MKNKKKKVVYVAMSADILHEGHINILKIASKYGQVVVGLLTDEVISSYKKFPHFNYDQRELVLKNMKYIKKIIPQTSHDYTQNLNLIKPNFVIHGDDWKTGIQKEIRNKVIKTLKKWSGKLIEPRYTKGISSSDIKNKILKTGVTPDQRRSKLRRLLKAKDFLRILETHSPLAGLIVENSYYIKKNKRYEYDGMWSSSLTDSVSRGMPDNQSVDYSTRLSGINDIFNVTTKPMIFDIDNGGNIEHLPFLIKKAERLGVSAVIMEDKIGLKVSSLFKKQKSSSQDTIKNFVKKIKKIKEVQISDDFMQISRIESLILGNGLNDAYKRAIEYSKAGSDAIMIHSNKKTPQEILKFCKMFNRSKYKKPIIAVPSTYSKTSEKKLSDAGVKIVIYANQMLRTSYKAMLKTSQNILKNKRAYESEKDMTSVKDIISLIN